MKRLLVTSLLVLSCQGKDDKTIVAPAPEPSQTPEPTPTVTPSGDTVSIKEFNALSTFTLDYFFKMSSGRWVGPCIGDQAGWVSKKIGLDISSTKIDLLEFNYTNNHGCGGDPQPADGKPQTFPVETASWASNWFTVKSTKSFLLQPVDQKTLIYKDEEGKSVTLQR